MTGSRGMDMKWHKADDGMRSTDAANEAYLFEPSTILDGERSRSMLSWSSKEMLLRMMIKIPRLNALPLM